LFGIIDEQFLARSRSISLLCYKLRERRSNALLWRREQVDRLISLTHCRDE
jgi:hypothetical protein